MDGELYKEGVLASVQTGKPLVIQIEGIQYKELVQKVFIGAERTKERRKEMGRA